MNELKTGAEKRAEDSSVEYADYEMCRKSKVGEFIQTGVEFFIVDVKKKKVYSSLDLRLRDLSEKVDSENTFIVKEARYV